MLIFFTSLAGHGHVRPLAPLALAAREAGHQIVFGTGKRFRGLVEGLGFEFLPVGDEGDQDESPDDERVQLAVRAFGWRLPVRFIADLVPVFGEIDPDLVVYEAAALGAGIAARLAGVPGVCHGFGRGTVPDERAIRPFVAYAGRFGVDLSGVALGERYLDIYPESLQDEGFLALVRRQPLRPVALPSMGDVPRWLSESGPPIVYLTLGTVFGDARVFRDTLIGLGGLGVRVLVAFGAGVERAELGPLPESVDARPWINQAAVLPQADLIVHHGGSGTALGALAAGVPQLFLPQGADQFVNAKHISAAGAGRQLLGDVVTAEDVRSGAGELLASQDAQEAAYTIAAEIAQMPSPYEVVREIFS